MEACIFCKIVHREIPSSIVYEDDDALVFQDIQPEAPVHLLCIPKKHVEWGEEHHALLFDTLFGVAKKVANDKGIFDACKFIFNVGKTGHVSHVHLHILGGWTDNIPMSNILSNI